MFILYSFVPDTHFNLPRRIHSGTKILEAVAEADAVLHQHCLRQPLAEIRLGELQSHCVPLATTLNHCLAIGVHVQSRLGIRRGEPWSQKSLFIYFAKGQEGPAQIEKCTILVATTAALRPKKRPGDQQVMSPTWF